MQRIYLDANASCPPRPEVLVKIQEALSLVGNPSSFHEHGRSLRAYLDEARFYVGRALFAQPKDIIFTSGASEANRLFIDALILEAQKRGACLKVLMSPLEHPSLLKPALKAHEDKYFDLRFLNINSLGDLSYDQDLNSLDIFICCQAHNETGIIPSLDKFILKLAPHTLIMSDIAQAFGRIEPVSQRVDVLTFSAQKMGGLAGAGGAVFRGLAKNLSAPWVGGGQEGGFRPGTEALLLIIGLGEAAKYIKQQRQEHQELEILRNYFEEIILSWGKAKIIGHNQVRLPNTSACCFYAYPDPEALRISCDMAGLSVGFGAACSGLAPVGSFALNSMGLSLHEQKTCVRFSLPLGIKKDSIDEALKRLRDII